MGIILGGNMIKLAVKINMSNKQHLYNSASFFSVGGVNFER